MDRYNVIMVGRADIGEFHARKDGKLYYYDYDRGAESGITNLSAGSLKSALKTPMYPYGVPMFFVEGKSINDEQALSAISDYVSHNSAKVYGFRLADKLSSEEKVQIFNYLYMEQIKEFFNEISQSGTLHKMAEKMPQSRLNGIMEDATEEYMEKFDAFMFFEAEEIFKKRLEDAEKIKSSKERELI